MKLISWFIFIFCLYWPVVSVSMEDSDTVYNEEFLKNMSSVPDLAKQCKSGQDKERGWCSEQDKEKLTNYILYFCGSMPENTHIRNQYHLKSYIFTPMLNTAFLRGWSWLNSQIQWPICVICFLKYPNDPYWEKHINFCTDYN